MKKSFIVLIAISTFIFTSIETHAQAKQAFFAELLGNGLIFSVNYDVRFTENPGGWGGRLGIGYVGSVEGGGGVVTIPIMVNNLLGKDGKYFEVGGGLTFITGTADFAGSENNSEIVGTLAFMYRRQPEDGGFMWKIGLSPIIADGVFFPIWPGVGFGYAW